uniref:Uncharacterized protein n=1 Tax=Meloidogyne incognita TaxID=6306 RepID=A0A914LAF2_MELIC
MLNIYFKFGSFWNNNVCSFVLISKCMSSNNNFLTPTRDNSRDVFAKNWLTEYLKFRNCCTFNSNTKLLNCLCSIKSDLIISCISIFDAQIIIFDIEIQIGKN